MFAEAYTDWRETQRMTAGKVYATANAAHTPTLQDETIEAIANLATATAVDRATTATLTATNQQLTTKLRKTQDKLLDALERLAIVAKTRQPLATIIPDNENTGRPAKTRPRNRHYCSTHGYLCPHTSGRCPDPAEGHQRYATARDPKGGSKINKEKWL